MAKQYGLIVPNKDKDKTITRPSIFDEDSDTDETVERPTGLKRALKKQEKITQHKAIEEDPTVYQYDEIYDEMDKRRKESKLSRKDLDRKPKYISRLLAAADKRKKENERRIERQVQKERETEGDEFKDKEAFVTSGYKKKLEEMKEMEEQDRREEYLESIGDVKKQGNLDGFYRHLYDQKVNYDDKINQEGTTVKEETDAVEDHDLDDKNKVNVRKYRQRKDSDKSEDEENTEVKKEHLQSNLDADSDFSIDSSDGEDNEQKTNEAVNKTAGSGEEEKSEVEQVIKEEKNLIEDAPKETEPKKPKIDIWKKRTVGEAFDGAFQRYFERKSLRELNF